MGQPFKKITYKPFSIKGLKWVSLLDWNHLSRFFLLLFESDSRLSIQVNCKNLVEPFQLNFFFNGIYNTVHIIINNKYNKVIRGELVSLMVQLKWLIIQESFVIKV